MKEWIAGIIAIMFTAAIIVFFGMGKIPSELFCSLATGAIIWWFKDKQYEAIMKRLKK